MATISLIPIGNYILYSLKRNVVDIKIAGISGYVSYENHTHCYIQHIMLRFTPYWVFAFALLTLDKLPADFG
jgi:hypothetical protein